MNYKALLKMLGVCFALFAGTAQGATIVVDDFESYTVSVNLPAEYIQNQPSSPWNRFGGATADGIYSTATGGVGGSKGALYTADWSAGAFGFVQYTFGSVQDLSLLSTVNLDLNVNTAIAGTTTTLQLVSSG